MSPTITVAGHDLSFECAEGETVLDAVERAGYAIPYSCRKGVCSSCEGYLLSGEAVVRGQGLRHGPADRVLFCQARPNTDLAIAPAWIRKVLPVVRKVFEGKVRKVERPTSDVYVVRLRLPIGQRATFRAGQYLRVLLPDGDSRNYSMANSPVRNDELELHIRHVPGGKFSESMLAGLDKGSRLEIELPYGEFSFTDDNDRDAILIATGTGFAPIKALVEDQIRLGATRPVHLYWGVNTEADLYMRDVADQWAQTYDWLTFTPVVSNPSKQWLGRTGFVHLAVKTDYPDMTEMEVYACGAPAMIEAARTDFTTMAGLEVDRFFSDAFVPSGDPERDAGAVQIIQGA